MNLTETQKATIATGLAESQLIVIEDKNEAQARAAFLTSVLRETTDLITEFNTNPDGFAEYLNNRVETLEETKDDNNHMFGLWSGANAILRALNSFLNEEE